MKLSRVVLQAARFGQEWHSTCARACAFLPPEGVANAAGSVGACAPRTGSKGHEGRQAAWCWQAVSVPWFGEGYRQVG